MTLYRLISEGSTLFINLRWILLTFDKKDSKFYSLNAIMVLIMFGVCRIVPIAPMWYVMLHYPHLPDWPHIHFYIQVMLTGICVILDSLNLYWYVKILSLVWKFFSSAFSSSSSSSQTCQVVGGGLESDEPLLSKDID